MQALRRYGALGLIVEYSFFCLMASVLSFATAPHAHALSAAPVCTLDISPSVSVGLSSSFTFSTAISNAGPDNAFGPFVEFVLPSQVTYNSATYSVGSIALTPLISQVVTDNDGGSPTTGTVTNSLTGQSVLLPVGDRYLLFQPLQGSFTVAQPPVSVQIQATLAGGLTLGVPLSHSIQSRCGFSLGTDPLDNPATDPPIYSTFQTAQVVPSLFTLTKSLTTLYGESETATGYNFPVTYTVSADVTNATTIAPLTLTDGLNSKFQFRRVVSVVGSGYTITFTPSSGSPQVSSSVPFTPTPGFGPGGTISVTFPTVTGSSSLTDASIVYEVYVPEKDLGNVDILSADLGTSVGIPNSASASGTYSGSPVAATSNTVTVDAKSLAVQKTAAEFSDIGATGYTPGDTVQFTLNAQVSDYFSMDKLVLEDLMADGLTYVSGSARLSVTEDGTTTGGLAFSETTLAEASAVTGPAPYSFAACGGCTLAITPDTLDNNDVITPPGDGRTIMAFDVSTLTDAQSGLDGEFIGGLRGGAPVGQPTHVVITYRAVINEDFINTQVNDKSIDTDDTLTNSVSGSARITSGTIPDTYITDTSSATLTILPAQFQKDIIAYKPVSSALDAQPFSVSQPLRVAAGDKVTYRLQVDIPSGDMERLHIKDYFPIPFYDVTEVSTLFDATVYTPTDGNSSSVPPTGKVAYASGSSGMITFPTPTITIDSVNNSLAIEFLSTTALEQSPSLPIHLELLVTLTAQPKPIADSLYLVNLGSFSVDNSAGNSSSSGVSAVQNITQMPDVRVTKGAVRSDGIAPVFSPTTVGPVVFNPPGSAVPYVGAGFSSQDLAAATVRSDVSSVDAGDRVRFVGILENRGTAFAYDARYTDLVPAGFLSPSSVADLNLRVYDAAGNDLSAQTTGGLFGRIVTGGATNGAGDTYLTLNPLSPLLPLSSSAQTLDGQLNQGKNMLVIAYELKLDTTVAPYSTHINTGKLTKYAAISGGPNFVDPLDPPTDSVTTQIAGAALSKTVINAPVGNETFTPTGTATIGEVSRYKLAITLPEGTSPSFVLNDNIPADIRYNMTTGVIIDGSASCSGVAFSGTLPGVAVNTPVGAGYAAAGDDLQVTLTSAVVADDNVTNNNTFCLYYDVAVNTNPSGSNNKVNSATLQFGANTVGPQTSTISVVQPYLQVTKGVSPASADAGNVVLYTIQVSHRTTAPISTAPAFDISVADIVDPKLLVDLSLSNINFGTDGLDNDDDGSTDEADEITGAFYNPGTKTFTFTGANTSNTKFDNLALGQTITLRFRAKVLSTVTPSEIVPNTATATYTSIPGTPVSGIEKSAVVNGSQNLSIVTITDDKAVFSTSLAATTSAQVIAGNSDLAIGEQATFRVHVNIPESSVSNLVITDSLPSLLRVDSATIVGNDTGDPGVVSLNDTNADLILDQAVITFATINPPVLPSASTAFRTITIDIVATVMNNGANVNGQTKTNTVSASWTGGGPITASTAFDIVEPSLTINKSLSSNAGDAGDSTIVTLTASHLASSREDAFDVIMTDTVPAGLVLDSNFGADGVDNDNDGLSDAFDPDESSLATAAVSGATVTFSFATTGNPLFSQLLRTPPQSLTYRFRVTVASSVFPNQQITNTAQVAWTSLPGVDAQERAKNASSQATYTVLPLSISKSTFSTTNPDTSAAAFNPALQDLAIGEHATYHISVVVPEGALSSLSIVDNVPPRFRAVSGSLVNDAGLTYGPLTITPSDSAFADGVNDRITFSFGNVTNAPDLDTETLIVAVEVEVRNAVQNAAGTNYLNTAQVTYTELTGGPLTSSVGVDVVEPSLLVTKTPSTLSGDAGDVVIFTTTIQNTGSSRAYDVTVTDDPPADYSVVTTFTSDGLDNDGDGSIDEIGEGAGLYDGNSFTWSSAVNAQLASIAPTATITFMYKTTLALSVTPNQSLNNTAQAVYSSLSGVVAAERSYNASDGATVTAINTVGITKTLRDVDTEKAIREVTPYRITLQIQEGTIPGVIARDTLPADMVLVPGSVVITSSNAAEISWAGTPQTPTVVPPSTTHGTAATQQIDFTFGTVTNANTDNGVTEYIYIEYDALAMNTSSNNSGNTKQNSSQVFINTSTLVGTSLAPPVTIVEPIITVQLAAIYTVGNTVTYQVTMKNNAPYSSASLYDAQVAVTLPAGVTYASNLVQINGPSTPAVNIAGAPTIVFSLSSLSPIYNNGNPAVFTFDATISNTVAPGTSLMATAVLTGTSQSGVNGLGVTGNALTGERTGNISDPGGAQNDYISQQSASITSTYPFLSTSSKTVTDLNGAPVLINDVLKYQIQIKNTGNVAATGITVTDQLPAHVNSFTITTFPGSGVNTSSIAPAGTNGTGVLSFTNIQLDAAGGANDTRVIEYTVVVSQGTPDLTVLSNNAVISPALQGGPGGSYTVNVTVLAPKIQINKVIQGPIEIRPTDSTKVVITVDNLGSAASTNVVITDPLPPLVAYLPGTIKLSTATQTDVLDGDTSDFGQSLGGAVTSVIASLPPAGQAVLEFFVTANPTLVTTPQLNIAHVVDNQGADAYAQAQLTILPTGGTSIILNPLLPPSPPSPPPDPHFDEWQGTALTDNFVPKTNEEALFETEKGNDQVPEIPGEGGVVCHPVANPQPEIIQSSCLSLDTNRGLWFSDLDRKDTYAPYITTLKNTKITATGDYVFSGTGNHSTGKQQAKFKTGFWPFQPEREVSRLEVVKVALISNCIPVEDTISVPRNGFRFADLPPDVPEYKEQENFAARVFYTAYKHGVITGFSDTSARPFSVATNAETLAILMRASHVIPEGYDVSHGAWFERYIRFGNTNGLFTGTDILHPTANMKRNDFAKVIVRTMAFNPDPGIYGYIERVNILDQTFYESAPVSVPQPNLTAFDIKPKDAAAQVCVLPAADQCLKHDPTRVLSFSDVDEQAWYAPFVEILRTTMIAKFGDYIASGAGNQSTGRQQEKYQLGEWNYNPDQFATRLEVVKVALVANCITIEDEIPVPVTRFRFADLPATTSPSDEANHFVARVFYTAYKHGIATGRDNIYARPYEHVSRAEALAILSRAAKNDTVYQVPKSLPYKDVPVTTWYAPTLAYLVEKGVVGQDGERLFHPERLVKRSEIAKLVFDYMTLNDREGIKAYAASLIDYYHLDGYRTIVNQAFFTSSGSVLDGVSPLTNVETR